MPAFIRITCHGILNNKWQNFIILPFEITMKVWMLFFLFQDKIQSGLVRSYNFYI
jgi:hypothetical protein